MMTCERLKRADDIQRLREDYLHTLVAPMDGMWESALIAQAEFWALQDHGERLGHFCLDANNDLLRFYLLGDDLAQASEVFGWVISTYGIQGAFASTIEPPYYSLCLASASGSALHSYLFRDSGPVEQAFNLSSGAFRRAEMSELGDVVRFYHANTAGSGDWVEAFVSAHLTRGEIYGLWDERTLVATGECRPSQTQPPYADVGMVVAQAYRGRGLGSAMLTRLKQRCYAAGWQPICSCEAANHASRKAIEKAGFVSEHSIVKVLF